MSGYILYTWILLSWLTNPFLRSTSSLSGGLPTIPCRHHIIACLYNTKAWKSMKAAGPSKWFKAAHSIPFFNVRAPTERAAYQTPHTWLEPTLVYWQIIEFWPRRVTCFCISALLSLHFGQLASLSWSVSCLGHLVAVASAAAPVFATCLSNFLSLTTSPTLRVSKSCKQHNWHLFQGQG